MAVEAMGMQIRIPQGDTGTVKFVYDKEELTGDATALFTIANRNGGVILRKMLSPVENEGAFHLPFTHEETANLKPDSYDWSLRVVENGTFDTNGKIRSAAVSNTVVLCGMLTILPVAGGAR